MNSKLGNNAVAPRHCPFPCFHQSGKLVAATRISAEMPSKLSMPAGGTNEPMALDPPVFVSQANVFSCEPAAPQSSHEKLMPAAVADGIRNVVINAAQTTNAVV